MAQRPVNPPASSQPNYDPITGKWHANSDWRRYEPQPQQEGFSADEVPASPDTGASIGGLQDSFPVSDYQGPLSPDTGATSDGLQEQFTKNPPLKGLMTPGWDEAPKDYLSDRLRGRNVVGMGMDALGIEAGSFADKAARLPGAVVDTYGDALHSIIGGAGKAWDYLSKVQPSHQTLRRNNDIQLPPSPPALSSIDSSALPPTATPLPLNAPTATPPQPLQSQGASPNPIIRQTPGTNSFSNRTDYSQAPLNALQQIGPLSPEDRSDNMDRLSSSSMSRSNTPTSDPVALQGLRDTRLQEMARNLGFQKQSPATFGTGATPSDFNSLNAASLNDPYTGTNATARQSLLDKAFFDAQLGGFQTPQAAAQSATEEKHYELDAGLRENEATARGDLAEHQVDVAGELAVEKQKGDNTVTGATNMLKMMQDLQLGGNPPDIRSMSLRNGSFTLGAPPRASASLANAVTTTRANLEAALQGAGVGANREEIAIARAAHNQAVANVRHEYAANHNTPIELVQFVDFASSDPELMNLDLPALLKHPKVIDLWDVEFTPAEERAVFEMLNLTKDQGIQ